MQKTQGQQIRELREKEDLSLRELARKLNISAAFLSDIELGRRHPSGRVLRKIADELNTTKEDLEKYDTRPPIEELRRLTESNPTYGIAFRRMLESEATPQDIIKWAEEKENAKKGESKEK